jgi:guanosine-3',5'-bis(diphosphate) 3'-pyrophosphohydrolase
MSPQDRAIQIAVESHAGQVDKVGAPYVTHPMRVMARMNTETERIVAVLTTLSRIAGAFRCSLFGRAT